MIDLRLWRISLLAVPLAVCIAMFSLQEVPGAREPALAPDAYEGTAAVTLTRELAESAANPRPGSEADDAIADRVRAWFEGLAGAQVALQDFEVEGRALRNVIAVLPGSSERQLALIAHRDVQAGSGAASSIASTAVLLEIAASFSGTTHRKTLVFVSTDGGSLGAAGARRFVHNYSDAEDLDAAVVVSQPAAAEPWTPLSVPWSSGPQSSGIELVETARAAIVEQTQRQPGNEGPLRELFRLALPSGLGEQAPLVESGLDSVRISSAGELPLSPGESGPSDVAPESVERFGRAAFALLLALDTAPSPLEHGPGAYVSLAGNLLPGWALALIGLSLLFPVAVAAAAGIGSSARSPAEAARGLAWASARAIPFVASLLALYFLGWVGLIPDPPFPFDPGLERLGVAGAIGVALCAGVAAGGFWLLRALRPPPSEAAAAAAPVTLALAASAVLLVAVANPYLALLLALGLNAWVIAGMPRIPNRPAAAALVALGLLPIAFAIGDLAARFEVGPGVFVSLLIMVGDGQIGFGLALLACVLAGCATALVAVAGPGPPPPAPEIRVLDRLREGALRRPGVLRRRERRRRRAGQAGERPQRPGSPSRRWS